MSDIERLLAEYLFLTKEMLKFLDQEDIDMFFNLMDQRETLQGKIDDCLREYPNFIAKPDLKQQIILTDKAIMQKLQWNVNAAKKKESITVAYEGYAGKMQAGLRGDWKR